MKSWVARKHYQFEAITSLTMLEPAEKRVICIPRPLQYIGLVFHENLKPQGSPQACLE